MTGGRLCGQGSRTAQERLRRAIDDAVGTLAAAGIDTPRVDAEQLAAHTAGVDRGRLRFHEPDEPFFGRYRDVIDARARRIPLQHLTSTAAFGPVLLTVGPGVFIPRPETESMLEWALAARASGTRGGPRRSTVDRRSVHRVGCAGGGAGRCESWCPDRRRRRLRRRAAPTRDATVRRRAVELVEADVTAPDLLADHDGAVDLIVANPPYIPDGAQLGTGSGPT